MSRAATLTKLDTGDPLSAIAMLEDILRDAPDDPDLLGLKGIALDEAGDQDGAEAVLRRALDMPGEMAIRLRNLANLASLLFDARRRHDAAALLKDLQLHWDEERAPQANELTCLVRLAEVMQHLGLHAETVALLSPVPAHIEPDWAILKPLVTALARTGETAQALELLDTHQPGDAVTHEREALRAHLCWTEGRLRESADARRQYLASVPPVILPRRDSQRLLIGVIDKAPAGEKLLAPWPRAYFTENYPPQPAKLFPDRYGLAGIFCGAGDKAIAQFKAWQPDLVINNVTNAEYLLTSDNLKHAQDFMDQVAPCAINPPKAAAACTRQMVPERLAGIEGLITPLVRRFCRDISRIKKLIAEIERRTAYPMILRTVYEQESRNVTLVRSRTELETAICNLNRAQFYVIEYLGRPRDLGYFRRIRAAFVAGRPIIIRADHAREWIVRSRHYIDVQIYHDHPDLLAKANAIIVNPDEELGERAMAALHAAGQQMPLDIFGMDFDVDDEGNVICFEANATMGLMKPAPEPFPYPPEANQRLTAALDWLFERLAAQRA